MKLLDRKRAVRAAVVMLAAVLLVAITTAFAFYNPEKHTGPVTVDAFAFSGGVQFVRPNGEIFVMAFAKYGPDLRVGDEFSDIVYVDSAHDTRYFVKALRTKRDPQKAGVYLVGATYECNSGPCVQISGSDFTTRAEPKHSAKGRSGKP